MEPEPPRVSRDLAYVRGERARVRAAVTRVSDRGRAYGGARSRRAILKSSRVFQIVNITFSYKGNTRDVRNNARYFSASRNIAGTSRTGNARRM